MVFVLYNLGLPSANRQLADCSGLVNIYLTVNQFTLTRWRTEKNKRNRVSIKKRKKKNTRQVWTESNSEMVNVLSGSSVQAGRVGLNSILTSRKKPPQNASLSGDGKGKDHWKHTHAWGEGWRSEVFPSVLSGAERFHTQRKKTCESSRGRRPGETTGAEKSNGKSDGSVREREGEGERERRAAAQRPSPVLSHWLATRGESGCDGWVPGGKLQLMDSSPRHQPLHRHRCPAGGDAHHHRIKSTGWKAEVSRWFVMREPLVSQSFMGWMNSVPVWLYLTEI